MADCFHCEKFSSCVQSECPQDQLVPITLTIIFSVGLLVKRESPSSLYPPFKY